MDARNVFPNMVLNQHVNIPCDGFTNIVNHLNDIKFEISMLKTD